MLEVLAPGVYLKAMSHTLEQRVEDLEKRFAELSAKLSRMEPAKKDWRSTVGTLQNDDLSRDAERLGREYRKQQTYEKEIAGS